MPIANLDEHARPEPDLRRFDRAYKLLEAGQEEGLLELRQLADDGSVLSMVHLGDAYRFGKVAKADFAEAEKYYRKAADHGSLLAHYFLGWLFLKQNRLEEAMRYLNLASGKGYGPATNFLGLIYITGRGVGKDVTRGESLLRRAIQQGSIAAQLGLSTSMITNSPTLRRRMIGITLRITAIIRSLAVFVKEGPRSDRLR